MNFLVRYLLPYFKNKENYLKYTKFGYNLEEYVSFVIYISLSMLFIGTFLMSLIIISLFRFYNIVLFLISLLFGVILSVSVFFYFYFYPTLAKTDYEKDIEDNLPFFALYIYAYSGSNTNIIDVLRTIANRKELGSLAKEIKYMISLMDILGYDFTSAIIEIANKTPSYKFKEFLYGLLSTIRSGGDLKEFIKVFAKESLNDYETKLKIYNDKANMYVTLYAFIFITFPLIILIMIFLLSYLSQNISLMNTIDMFFFYILPLSYVAYLYLIHISQPKL